MDYPIFLSERIFPEERLPTWKPVRDTVLELLQATYRLAKTGSLRAAAVSGWCVGRALVYEDERVQIKLAEPQQSLEIVWKSADRNKHGFSGGDNPVVMVLKPWRLIRLHGETNRIKDYIIQKARELDEQVHG
jgi:hypothetical protein